MHVTELTSFALITSFIEAKSGGTFRSIQYFGQCALHMSSSYHLCFYTIVQYCPNCFSRNEFTCMDVLSYRQNLYISTIIKSTLSTQLKFFYNVFYSSINFRCVEYTVSTFSLNGTRKFARCICVPRAPRSTCIRDAHK